MKLLPWLVNVSIAVVVIMGVFTIGPALETRLFPVYAPFNVIDVKPMPDGKGSTFTVELRKLRDCAPKGYAWYSTEMGPYKQALNVETDTSNPTPALPTGKFRAVFNIEGVTAADVAKLSAETFSYCHPLWSTRSEVYP